MLQVVIHNRVRTSIRVAGDVPTHRVDGEIGLIASVGTAMAAAACTGYAQELGQRFRRGVVVARICTSSLIRRFRVGLRIGIRFTNTVFDQGEQKRSELLTPVRPHGDQFGFVAWDTNWQIPFRMFIPAFTGQAVASRTKSVSKFGQRLFVSCFCFPCLITQSAAVFAAALP